MIFVSIASYRDKELVKTVKSLFENATYPDMITVGILWQYDETEDLNQFNDHRVLTHKVYWKDVEGSVCWARALIQEKFYDNQQWYFQVDSHTQFAPGWDIKLIQMYETIETASVISVGPPYYYDTSAHGGQKPSNMDRVFERNGLFYDKYISIQPLSSLTVTGDIMFGFKDASDLSKPMRARHVSAAWLFAPEKWVNDVPYDPNLYFHGEEATLALRSFTNGYDLYNPNDLVIWHLNYHFPTRDRHWNNFDDETIAEQTSISRDRFKRIMQSETGGKEFGKYGLGDKRSIKDWEIYSGLSYMDGIAHPDVWEGTPPNPVTIKDWNKWLEYKKRRNENS